MTTVERVEKETPDYNIFVEENKFASRVYQAAEILQKPLYFFCNTIIGRFLTVLTPGQFGNFNYRALEIIRRVALVFIIPGVAVAAVVGSPLAVGLNFIGDRLLGSRPYLCLPGAYTPLSDAGEKRIATFNMSTLLPPMTLIDGVEDSQKRLQTIASQIEGFHFVCGQEVDGASARFFAHALKDNFCVFYTYLGKSNPPFISSGLFFASKEKVLNVTVVPFTGSVQTTIRRELVIFEFEKCCVAITHLDGGSGDQISQIHLKEIQQITAALQPYTKPIILCGDFNEDRTKPSEAYRALTENFVDDLANQSESTCTDALKIARFGTAKTPTEESIDYITYRKDQMIVKDVRIEKTGILSDHKLVHGKLDF